MKFLLKEIVYKFEGRSLLGTVVAYYLRFICIEPCCIEREVEK